MIPLYPQTHFFAKLLVGSFNKAFVFRFAAMVGFEYPYTEVDRLGCVFQRRVPAKQHNVKALLERKNDRMNEKPCTAKSIVQILNDYICN